MQHNFDANFRAHPSYAFTDTLDIWDGSDGQCLLVLFLLGVQDTLNLNVWISIASKGLSLCTSMWMIPLGGKAGTVVQVTASMDGITVNVCFHCSC